MTKKPRPTIKTIWKLFVSTFNLSAFTFGGGYVIVPLMRKKFVEDLKWIKEKEMLNLIAIAQSSPGAVAVNVSILLGYDVAGKIGAVAAISGTILPPILIISVLSLFYEAFRDNEVVRAVMLGMQAGVAAVIMDVVFKLGSHVIRTREWVAILIMIASFVAVFFLHINILFILLAGALIGAVRLVLYERKRKTGDLS